MDLYASQLNRIEAKVDRCLAYLAAILTWEKRMSAEFDALTAQVAANTTVEQSCLTLINGMAAQISALAQSGGTPQQFADLAARLKATADPLAAAVTANTPPAPPGAMPAMKKKP